MAAHPRPGPAPRARVAIRKAMGALSIRLSGRRLVLARAAWLVLALPAVVLYAIGAWVELGRLGDPCPQRLCVRGQVPLATQRALASLHLSASIFSGFEFARNVLFGLGFGAVATLHFWRRSIPCPGVSRAVDLTLRQTTNSVILPVREDGVSLDPDGAFPGHPGPRSMRERTADLGGAFQICV